MFRAIRFPMIFLVIWFALTSSGLLVAHNYLEILKPSGAPPVRPYEVQLLAGSLKPEAGISAIDRNLLESQITTAKARGGGKIHALIQLYEIPDEEQVKALRAMGIEHKRLSVKFQGLDARLTGIAGRVVKDLLD